jgi:phosphoenolpyruvate-protein kinase (PTS system EI component)
MIEVAAAAVMVERWADDVDFFAIGTNDLLASALGIDRDNPLGQQPDDLLHPGWLSLIHDAAEAAHKAGRKVTVCGEMAADPYGAVALAACGADSLSVAVNHLGVVRSTLAKYSSQSLKKLLPQLVQLRTGCEVRQRLQQCDEMSSASFC